MPDSFLATHDRPMRVIAMDAAGALGFAFVLILFTIMGALTYDPLLFAVIPLLAVRRSAPVVALFGATILPGAQFMTNPLAFDLPLYGSTLFMTFSVAAFAVRRVRWMCAAPPLLAIALLGIQLVAPNTDLPPWGPTPRFNPDWLAQLLIADVTIALAFTAAFALGLLRRGQIVEQFRVRERAELLERDAHRLAELAVADERSRIAREMHDIIAHSLASIVTLAEGGRLNASAGASRDLFSKIGAAGRGALGDVKLLLRGVDAEGDVAPIRGLADIPALADSTRLPGTPGIRVSTLGTPVDLPAGMQAAMYRVAQESVTNMLKHAPGAPGELEVRWFDDHVQLRAVNPLVEGTSPPASDRRGIAGMRERAELFDGTLTVTTTDTSFEVLAIWPLPGVSAKEAA